MNGAEKECKDWLGVGSGCLGEWSGPHGLERCCRMSGRGRRRRWDQWPTQRGGGERECGMSPKLLLCSDKFSLGHVALDYLLCIWVEIPARRGGKKPELTIHCPRSPSPPAPPGSDHCQPVPVAGRQALQGPETGLIQVSPQLSRPGLEPPQVLSVC